MMTTTKKYALETAAHGTKSSNAISAAAVQSSAYIQRKAACSCGGGCPRCKENTAGHAVSQPSDALEIKADAMAEKVMHMPEGHSWNEPVQGRTGGNDAGLNAPPAMREVLSGIGKPMDAQTRSFMESRFNHDFSGVKIHDNGNAAESARSVNAQAYTLGQNIVFNAGRYAPKSTAGKQLLAHELAHVTQQNSAAPGTIMRAVDNAKVEAEFNAWADENSKVKDKTHKDFPWSAWDFIRPKIVNDVMEPLPKPKDSKAAQEWQDNFDRAEIIARWLFSLKASTADDGIKKDADSKAYFILDSLAQAGFVSKAIAQSGYLNSDTRTHVYDTILKSPALVVASELETIVNFQCNGVSDPDKVPIVQTFTNGNASPLKTLPADKTQAIFKALVAKYGSHDTIIKAIAEVLMFNPGIRVKLSDALMASEFGNPELLFKVLKHPYFIEPEYGASILANVIPAGMKPEDYETQRMMTDMPWVYTYKQKYYVQYLIDLAKGQKITIEKPKKMDFSGLKTWLDTNTEKIGETAKAAYPADPNAVFEIYKNIADIFFYHIPHERDAVPDLQGKIGHLKEGAPSKKRFEADCDVFATYAMRLFYNAGFEVIGYMAFVPEGSFSDRAAHVSALLRKGGNYHIINNKGILNAAVSETIPNDKKGEALKAMRKKSFRDAYGDPLPTELKIYYQDAGAKGEMSKLFKDQDSTLERADLL